MVIVVVIVSSSVLFCVVVDSFRFGAVWILSTRRLSVVRVVFHCCGFFPLQSRVDSFHSAAHRCPAVIVLSVSHYVAHWPCFIKGRAAGFWCGDSGVVHAGASQPGVGCTLLYGPRLLLARLLNLLSLRRNTEKLMMAADTPRNSSKTTTAVRGSGAGRKLHGIQLHPRHLLLGAFLLKVPLLLLTMFHLRHLLQGPSLLKMLMLLVPLPHLPHLLLHRFQLKVLMLLVPLLHLGHLLLTTVLHLRDLLHLPHLLLIPICSLPLSPSVGEALSS